MLKVEIRDVNILVSEQDELSFPDSQLHAPRNTHTAFHEASPASGRRAQHPCPWLVGGPVWFPVPRKQFPHLGIQQSVLKVYSPQLFFKKILSPC